MDKDVQLEQKPEKRLEPGYAFLPISSETIIDFCGRRQAVQSLGRELAFFDSIKMWNPELWDHLEGDGEYLIGAVLCYSILEIQQLKSPDHGCLPQISGDYLKKYLEDKSSGKDVIERISELREKESGESHLANFLWKEGSEMPERDSFFEGALDILGIFKKIQEERKAKLN
jgi:hypothetical protein